MGQKVNPHGLRVGVNTGWNSQWYASNKDFSKFLLEDKKIRDFIKKNYKNYGISKVVIDRAENKVVVSIYTSRPGLVIGQRGAGVEKDRLSVGDSGDLCGGAGNSVRRRGNRGRDRPAGNR